MEQGMAVEIESVLGSLNLTANIGGSTVPGTLASLLSGKQINFRQRMFNISDFGAVPDDSSPAACNANLTAFVNAGNALLGSTRGGTIVVPNDEYYLPSRFSLSPSQTCIIEGTGAGSKLIFNNTTTTELIRLHGGDNSIVGLRNLRVASFNSTNLGQMVYLRGGRGKRALLCDGVSLDGDTSSRPATSFLTLINPYNCSFRDINIEAGSVGSFGSTGIGILVKGDGENTPGAISVDFKFDATMISRVNTGFKIEPSATTNHTIEGAMFNDCIVAGVRTVMDMQSPGDLIPCLSWKGGHGNFSRYGFVLGKIAQFKISDTTLYADVGDGPVAALQTNSFCKDISFHHNTVYTVDTMNTGLTSGMNAVIVGGGSEDVDITFNKFNMQTVDAAIRIDPGALRTRHGFNDKVTGGGSMVNNSGTGTIDLFGNTVR